MNYRFGLKELTDTLEAWDNLMPGSGAVRLIACGGTALTLLGYKESTKDVDFLVPDPAEYGRLIKFLKDAGYEHATSDGWKRPDETLLFDLYQGKRIYCTELLDSPLATEGHKKVRQWKKISLGVLNAQDLIISKMFRGTETDVQDCLVLFRNENVDFKSLETRYRETASYDTGETKVLKHFDILKKRLGEEGLIP